jgi:hypothetical protein
LLFTAHRPPPFYQSLIAAVSRLADLPISRFADKFVSARASPSQTFAVDEGVQPLSNLLSISDLVRAIMMGCP